MIDFLLKVKELFKKEPTPQVKYTEEELMIRLKVFIAKLCLFFQPTKILGSKFSLKRSMTTTNGK